MWRLGPASLRTTAEPPSAAARLEASPPTFPGSYCPENQASCPAAAPPPGPSHKPQQTGSESALLSDQAACPLPTIYPSAGRRRRESSPLPSLCPSPSLPRFPVRGRDDRKSDANLGPPFSLAGRGASAAPPATFPPPGSRSPGCASRPRHLVAALGRSSRSRARAGRGRGASEFGSRNKEGGRRGAWTRTLPRGGWLPALLA